MKTKKAIFNKKALICLLLFITVSVSVFAIFAFAGSASADEGRSFSGNSAVANVNQRLELTKPLDTVPLTYEATIKIDGTTDALCKGTLFGNYGNSTGSYTTLFNFEIFRNASATKPAPALCYSNKADGSSFGAVAFSRDSSVIVDESGKTNTLSDHLGEWVHVIITVTPTGNAGEYDFDCYINGEKAYNTLRRQNVFFTDELIGTLQSQNAFALGSNAKISDPVEFPGKIKNLALYENALTGDEARAAYENGIDTTRKDIIAHYDMSVVENLWRETDLSGNGYDLARADRIYNVNSEGRTFSNERLALINQITEAPLTLEAVIKTRSTGTTIFGNTTTSSVGCLNLEIFGGDPALCFPVDETGKRGSVIFKTPISEELGFNPNTDDKGDFTYIAITATPTGAANTYNFDCYVNGVKAYETITNKVAYLDPTLIQAAGNLAIGSNGNSTNFFDGNIRRVNLYSRPLTAAEIRASYHFETTFDGMIAGFDMTDSSHIRNPQFEADISGNGYHAQRATNTNTGKWFDSTAGGDKKSETAAAADPYFIHNIITEMPRSYEATVYPTTKNGTIIGNYPNASASCTNLEIYQGKIALVNRTYDYSANKYVNDQSVIFNYLIPMNQWTHLIVANEVVGGKSVYKLYINGVLTETKTDRPFVHDVIAGIYGDSQTMTRKISLGGSGVRHFSGGIIDTALYSRALTAEEVADSFSNGVDKHNDSLIAYYDLKTVAGDDFIQDLSGNNHHAARFDYNEAEGGRWFNLDEERLATVKNYDKAPLTISAEIYIPETVDKANTIFGNFYARDYINFEITSGNRAALVINELPRNLIETGSTAYIHSIVFNETIPRGRWTTLTVVYDRYSNTADRYALYVDGVKSEAGYTFGGIHNDKNSAGNNTVAHSFELDMEWIQRAIPFTLGRDASKCFRGKIKNLALYSSPLSSEQIAYAYANGADLECEDIIAYYDLDSSKNTKTYVFDETGNGYDFEYKFFESESDEEFDYSFAFIGDTQFMIYKDITEGTTENTKAIYDWLIKNKDEKNIQYVFGLGDVSDKNMMAEYNYASYLFKTLGDAGINYAVIPGNHDGQTTYINYTDVFSGDSYLMNGMTAYTPDTPTNYYKTFEVGEYKYMVIVLEFGAPDAVLDWANAAVAAHSDRQVIVLTHGYIGYDGGFLSEKELHSPNSNSGLNSGEDIWEKFVSQHSNIIISACGHIDPYNIKQRHDVGVNGNTVHQFLIDNQALDKTWSYDTGMIAMFYFSDGGKNVRVEYVSATQSMRAQQNDESARDIVFGKENQFSFTLDTAKAEPIETVYGNISTVNSNLDLNAVVLFDASKTFLGGYASIDLALADMLTHDKAADYFMLLRSDVRMSSNVGMGSFIGNLTVDMNGFEIVLDASGNYLIDIYVTNASAPKSSYTFKNGSITKAGGRSINCLNYGTESFTADTDTTFTYENVTFRSIAGDLTTNVIFASWENGYDVASANMNVHATFIDCTFDMRNSIRNAVMLPLGANGKDRTVYDVTLEGGKILVSDTSDIERFYTADADTNGRADILEFAKEGGKYTSLVSLTDAANNSSSLVFKTAEGYECIFHKASESAENVNFSLYPKVMLGYKIKNSITLYSNLIYNIYVPSADYVSAISIDGKLLTDADYTTETVILDSVEYTRISVPLAAKESLRDIAVKVYLVSGESEVAAAWTVNVPKYARSILESDAGDEEKTLVKNILSFARSAYEYFADASGEAEKLAYIDTVLGESYDTVTAPDMEKEALTPAEGRGFKSVTVNLAGTPSYRFYLASGFDADDFTFTVGGIRVEAKQGSNENGTYLDIVTYAYRMLDDISYTVTIDGTTYTETYNLYAYYNYVKTEKPTDTALHVIVERLAAYAESAKAYKLSIDAN